MQFTPFKEKDHHSHKISQILLIQNYDDASSFASSVSNTFFLQH